MKRILLLLSFLLSFVFVYSSQSSIGSTIKHRYTFLPPIIKSQSDGTSLLYFSKCFQAGKIGEPTLPLNPCALLLPPGHVAKDIRVTFINRKQLGKRLVLSPKQSPRTEFLPQSSKVLNEQVYASNKIYKCPNPSVQTHFWYGHSIALSHFSPVEYIPSSGEIFYYSEIEIELTTYPETRAHDAHRNYRSFKNVTRHLSKIVDNFDQAIGLYPSQNDESIYDYLIITINDFIDDYQPLVRFYNERGTRTKIVSVEEIYQTIPGIDEPEKIRNYIIDQTQKFGITYVLLAGDADLSMAGEVQVPIRGFYCKVLSGEDVYEDKNIPTDLYYAALDGNWNDDGDDRWGEPGEDDLLPELAVARICADNSDEISAILNKIFSYQSSPVIEDATKMLMAGERMWNDPLSYGADYLDLLIGAQNENGYSTFGMPPDLDFIYLYDRTLGSWSAVDLIKTINEGCNIIHHAGHSSSSSNMRMSRSSITNDNFANLDGITHLNPVIYSHGCLAAAVDITNFVGQDCIAEMMVEIDNFASAYIGNTRYGWFNEGQTEGPSLHLHREFVNALYSDNVVAIGAAHTLSRIRTAPFVTMPHQWEPGALRWCFYGCNVLGDPAMSLWTHQIEDFSQVNYPDKIWSIPSTVTIQTGVPNARVTISADGKILATTLTNPSGEAFLNVENVSGSALKLTITALNHKPFAGNIYLELTSVQHERSNDALQFELKPTYPNPFNTKTTIQYSITTSDHVTLEIYNLMGQRIRTLINEKMSPGSHQVVWDGKDDFGNTTGSGLYFVKLVSIEGIRFENCVLLK